MYPGLSKSLESGILIYVIDEYPVLFPFQNSYPLTPTK